MTYAEWYQKVEKPRLAAISDDTRAVNAETHWIGNVDGVSRCLKCEIASWNSWQTPCPSAA